MLGYFDVQGKLVKLIDKIRPGLLRQVGKD